MVALTAFADNPQALMLFCHRWSIFNAHTRMITVTCAGCAASLMLVFAHDVALTDAETKVFLVFELLGRGWRVPHGQPMCPQCKNES
jgi:hypothetical protein